MKMNKKAAIELSIGTVVIIVLGISMLILGGVLISDIFGSATGAINQIDRGVKNEITKLFSENNERKLVLYPDTGIIELKQDSKGSGFAISIRNTDDFGESDFSYDVSMSSVGPSCGTGMTLAQMENYIKISAGESATAIPLPGGSAMENPIHVRFTVSESSPTCIVRYQITVRKGTDAYQTGFMDVEITPK